MSASISIERLRARRAAGEPVIVLDVREPEAFAAGHVAGARSAPLPTIQADPTSLPLHLPLVTACGKGGGRSEAAAALLAAAGATDVAWLEGGTTGWAASGGPIEEE
jgi:rhodanese-related sulfurtransferase